MIESTLFEELHKRDMTLTEEEVHALWESLSTSRNGDVSEKASQAFEDRLNGLLIECMMVHAVFTGDTLIDINEETGEFNFSLSGEGNRRVEQMLKRPKPE